MIFNDDIDAWENCNPADLWVFNKLTVSRTLNYYCGPTGTDVPKPDVYITRPCINLMGMGREAKFVFIEEETDDVVPIGHFWCEVFKGRHLSIDYRWGQQVLGVEGFRNPDDPLYRFSLWKKVQDKIPLPKIFETLSKRYEYINIEYIDGNPIEVHMRHNPDFHNRDCTALIPVWEDAGTTHRNFIKDEEYKRKGFIVIK